MNEPAMLMMMLAVLPSTRNMLGMASFSPSVNSSLCRKRMMPSRLFSVHWRMASGMLSTLAAWCM